MSLPPAAPRDLTSDDTLHRVLLSAKSAEDLHEAFMLRKDERDSGLSVNFDCTADEARMQDCFSKTYGAASLLVAAVTEMELQVVPDEPKHANIQGVPYKEDNPVQAEWLASQLAMRVIAVVRGRWKRTN